MLGVSGPATGPEGDEMQFEHECGDRIMLLY